MSNEAARLINQGINEHAAARREALWREIYGPLVHRDDMADRPLGKLEESRWRGTIAHIAGDMEKEGLAISPVELARLVDLRLRRGESKKPSDHATIAAEIEATLDLVEHCQWRIGLRKAEWKARVSNWAHPHFEKLIPPEEKAALAKIEAQTYPLDFQRGLILMGVGGDGPKERDKRFWPFFREQFIFSAQMQHQYGGAIDGRVSDVQSLVDFVEPSENEMRASLERRKTEGWFEARWLKRQREQWQRYRLGQRKEARSHAGKKSGEARKPKAKPAKTVKRAK